MRSRQRGGIGRVTILKDGRVMKGYTLAAALALAVGLCRAQDPPVPRLTPGAQRKAPSGAEAGKPQTIPLHLIVGTPIQVALADEVRVKQVGQPIRGKVVEPVYAFDQIVVPVGTEVLGRIEELGKISGKRRALSALDADFTPQREVNVTFEELALPGGTHIAMQTSVTPGSGQVLQLVRAAEPEKKSGVKGEASEKAKEAKEQARQQWGHAMQEIHTPGHLRRAVRWGQRLLPARQQYIPAGTVYFAELKTPLEFGSEAMTPQMAQGIGAALPSGVLVRARLLTPLNSATTQRGDAVEAVVSRPLFDGFGTRIAAGKPLEGYGAAGEPGAAHEEERAATARVPRDGSSGGCGAKSRGDLGGGAGGQRRECEAGFGRRRGGDHIEDAVSAYCAFVGAGGRIGEAGSG